MKNLRLFLAAVCLCAVSPALHAEAVPPDSVRASSFGFNEEDATECLQKALDSGAKTVIVDQVGKPWIVRPLFLRTNDQTVHFEKDVLVLAKKDEFKGKRDSLFSAAGVDGLTLEGEEGATLKMRKKDYLDFSKYEKAEWRTIIDLKGCNNVTIRGLKLVSSGGDGVCISRLYGPAPRIACRNVLIENCVIDDNHRQGISVISVIGLTVRKCVISNTFGTEPQAGIDCETDYRDEYQQDILVEDTVFRGNGGGGFVFASVSIHPVSATLRNCVFDKDYLCGIMFSRGGDVPTTGKIRIENCKINVLVGNYPPWYAEGRDCTTIPFYYMNTGSGLFDVEVENLEISAPDIPLKLRVSPLSFFYTSVWENKTGKNTFRNVTVNGMKDVPLIYHGDWTGKIPLKVQDFEGTIRFNGKEIDLQSHIREQKLDVLSEIKPHPAAHVKTAELSLPAVFPQKSAPSVVNPEMNLTIGENKGRELPGLHRPELCRNFKMYFLGKKGMTTKIVCNYYHSMYERNAVKALLTDGKGHIIPLGVFENGINTFTVTWPADGVYMMHFISRDSLLKLVGGENLYPSFAQSSTGGGFFMMIFLPDVYTGYFEVPAETGKFTLDVRGDPLEPTSVEIRNEAGELAASLRNFDKPHTLELEKKSGKREIWSFTFLNSMENVSIRFHEPLTGVWAEDPSCLPERKRD